MQIAAFALLAAALSYPPARRDPLVEDHFGTRVADPYRWMEDLESPETQQWVAAENKLTQDELAKLPQREAFRKRLTELWNYERTEVPERVDNILYYRRNSGLQKQSVLYAGDRVLLDPNALYPDGNTQVGQWRVSPDGKCLAYTTAAGGSDLLDIHTLCGGKELGVVERAKFGGLSWAKDSSGFLYSRFKGTEGAVQFAGANKFHQVWFHPIAGGGDKLVFDRPDAPGDFVAGFTSDDGQFVFFQSSSGVYNREFFATGIGAKVQPLIAEQDARNRVLGSWKGLVYVSTSYQADNGRVVAIQPGDVDRSHWKTIVPESKEPISGALLVGGRIVVNRLSDVQSKLSLYDPAGKKLGDIALPDSGTADNLEARNGDGDFFFHFTSYLRPRSVFRYDLASGKLSAFDTPKTHFDASKYETRVVFYPSKDGTRVPMYITLRKGAPLDGSNPTIVYGYGGFDISYTPAFNVTAAAWLDAGGIWAVANLRGGSEYGEVWHHAGMREKKQTVFDDMIAAAEYLIREKYTSSKHLAVHGRSNGGLLVGAMMTQRPELFGVALPTVGVMDMLRFHKFTGGALWAEEYGNPDDPKMFGAIYKYSPLQNLKAGTCYPPTLATTSDRDDRVVPSHTFKFIAALQAAQGCPNPVLMRVEKAGSHAYRPTDRIIDETADQLAFALAHLTASP